VWTTQGSAQAIVMQDPVYAGLMATSAGTTPSVTAAFDSFSLAPAGNTGSWVEAGPHFTSGTTALLQGAVTDDNGTPAVHWEKVSGSGNVSLPGTASGSVFFDTGGYYTLRLVADDGLVRTFDDTVVTVTSPFTDWCMLHFGSNAADPLIGGPRADPDQDGLENLAEYVLTSDPSHPDSQAAPVSSQDTGTLKMTWRESTSTPDATAAPQWSPDMANWTSTGLTVEVLQSGTGWVEKRATLNVTGRPRACLRLRVTMP
jgi:hypothetical protein